MGLVTVENTPAIGSLFLYDVESGHGIAQCTQLEVKDGKDLDWEYVEVVATFRIPREFVRVLDCG